MSSQDRDYLTIAQAMAQNVEKTGFDWDDYIELETARTYTELKNKMTMKIKKRKVQQEQQQQMMMLQQQAEAEKQRQFAAQQQQMAEGGRNAREVRLIYSQKTMQPIVGSGRLRTCRTNNNVSKKPT
jgi:hypothetical protein